MQRCLRGNMLYRLKDVKSESLSTLDHKFYTNRSWIWSIYGHILRWKQRKSIWICRTHESQHSNNKLGFKSKKVHYPTVQSRNKDELELER